MDPGEEPTSEVKLVAAVKAKGRASFGLQVMVQVLESTEHPDPPDPGNPIDRRY